MSQCASSGHCVKSFCFQAQAKSDSISQLSAQNSSALQATYSTSFQWQGTILGGDQLHRPATFTLHGQPKSIVCSTTVNEVVEIKLGFECVQRKFVKWGVLRVAIRSAHQQHVTTECVICKWTLSCWRVYSTFSSFSFNNVDRKLKTRSQKGLTSR